MMAAFLIAMYLLELAAIVVGSPLTIGMHREDSIPLLTYCIQTRNSFGDNCSICSDNACPIDDKEMLAAFNNSSFHDILFGRETRRLQSYLLDANSPKQKQPRCAPIYPSSEDPGTGCAYVAKIGHDGCLQCYSKTCLQCNYTEHRENSSFYNAGLQLIGSSGLTFSQSLITCPPIRPPHQPPAGCLHVPYRGSSGCVEFYTLICPASENSEGHVTIPYNTVITVEINENHTQDIGNGTTAQELGSHVITKDLDGYSTTQSTGVQTTTQSTDLHTTAQSVDGRIATSASSVTASNATTSILEGYATARNVEGYATTQETGHEGTPAQNIENPITKPADPVDHVTTKNPPTAVTTVEDSAATTQISGDSISTEHQSTHGHVTTPQGIQGHMPTQPGFQGHVTTPRSVQGHVTTPGSVQGHVTTPQSIQGHVTAPHSTKCPKIKHPSRKPPAGCEYIKNVDKNGCTISYDLVCSSHGTSAPRPSKPIKEVKPNIAKNYNLDWRSMLGLDYKGSSMKDPKKFRPRSSLAVTTSGRFVGCKRQTDCFHYREPKEWCMQTAGNNGSYAWTNKSCYCANDTEKRSCLIERINVRTNAVEWTFCSPKKNFSCS